MTDPKNQLEELESRLFEAEDRIRKLEDHSHCPNCRVILVEGDEIFTDYDGLEFCCYGCMTAYNSD